jgi:hypothetical protein
MAIDHASGEYLARMDADDVCLVGRFRSQVEHLDKNPKTSVVSGFIFFIDEAGNQTEPWADDRKNITWRQIRSTLPWRCCLAHPSVMMRLNLFQKYRYNETQLHSQDWDLWLQLAADGKIIEKIPQVVLHYRVHSKSITATSLKKSAFLKTHETYKNYLTFAFSSGTLNWFNLRVTLAFIFNRLKLFLSGIKRRSIS